jgi:hypothetical protein
MRWNRNSKKGTSPWGGADRRLVHFRVGAWAAIAATVLAGGMNLVPRAVGQGPGQATPLPTASVMDEPLRLIASASQSYQQVRDYTCLFVKRERIRGQLQPENLVEMRVRSQPFSVYLRWLSPLDSAGQEACYVAGRNNGQMRVHSTGLAGVVGFVSLDPRDPRVAQNSRHTITEAGIGNLIGRFAQRWELERRLNRTQVRVAEYTYDRRPCTRVETIHADNAGGQFYTYRSVLYFDRETRLPVRVEAYDWPRPGGTPGGELLESYSYAHLRLNVGLDDRAFNY